MSRAMSFLASLAFMGFISVVLYMSGTPDLVMLVVGIGFFLGVIVVYGEIHSLGPVMGGPEELPPLGTVPPAATAPPAQHSESE